LLAILVVVPSCTTDYVTGKRTFSLISESQEVALGREAHPQIVAEYGLYENEEFATFFRDLGARMAKVSHRPQLEYTFRVLDTPVVNAFALPGGFTYVTRGILAHFNSEDELAGVLGHEIGHVVARHSAEQLSRQQLAGFGLGLGAMLNETFAQYVGVAGAGVGLLFLSFSRAQESESDRLGVEYSTRLGYDAHRMAGFFGTLSRLSGDSRESIPGFLSTHPDPGDREANVHRLTDEWQQKVEYKPLNKNPDDYLRMIDGIVYGDDPRQGFVEDGNFYHPEMKFKFPIPAGWDVVNSPSTVRVADSERSAIVLLRLGSEASAVAEADAFAASEGMTVLRRDAATVNGFPAQILEAGAVSQDQELRILSYFIEKDGRVFTFHGFTLAAQYDQHQANLRSVMAGFAGETDRSILDKKPSRIAIKPATRTTDLATALSELGIPSERHREFAIVNGRDLDEQVAQGTLLKVLAQ
jgi:predicted Zn-dependent protease